MEYKVALCDDDEKIASKIMEAFNNELHAHNLEATIDYYSSGNVLIEAVKEKHYNLALLDIDMTPLNGFDTAQSICSISSDTRIVFVTSHEELVFDTFEYTPFYFIRKKYYETGVKKLVNKLTHTDLLTTSVHLEKNGSITSIDSVSIKYAVSQDHMLNIYTTSGNYQLRKKLSDLENELAGYNFIRVHKSCLINYMHVRRFDAVCSEVIMKDGFRIKVGRSYKDTFKKGFVQYRRTM